MRVVLGEEQTGGKTTVSDGLKQDRARVLPTAAREDGLVKDQVIPCGSCRHQSDTAGPYE